MLSAKRQKPLARGFPFPFFLLMVGCLVFLVGMYLPSFSLSAARDGLDAHGVWVKTKSILSPARIDEMLERAEAGGFHVIFVNVFYEGQAYYASSLVEKSDKVEAGFDPLAYLVPEAHRRGIEVHAWFMVGKVGDEKHSSLLEKHPEWALVGADGAPTYWLNFNRPDVRDFVRRLVLETVEKYRVDGVHFDYTRYPDAKWGFDPYSVDDFRRKTGIDLDRLRFRDLPAYGFLQGNPLTNPLGAQVLAEFSNGIPAVTLNKFGNGEALLINWNATRRDLAAGSVILERGIEYLLDPGGEVNLLHSILNEKEYGLDSFSDAQNWLEYLGWEARVVEETNISALSADSMLILPNVYLIASSTAKDLAEFVQQGGSVIFIDGPTRSINIPAIQDITGMSTRGKYFNMATMIYPVIEHTLIPTNSWDSDLETYQTWIVAWKEYRQQGINLMLKDIHRAIKSKDRQVEVTMTITSDQQDAENRYLQDWNTWLKEKSIDYLIPRAYVDNLQDLSPLMSTWHPAMETYPGRIKIGLAAYIGSDQLDHAKTSSQLLSELDAARTAGSSGFMIFSLESMTDEQLFALKNRYQPAP